MKTFYCDHCRNRVFFENVQCLVCQHKLGYFADLGFVGSVEATADGLWRSPLQTAAGKTFRLCRNYEQESVCNWLVDSENANPYCFSCQFTHVLPDLGPPNHREYWYRLEAAKRRLIYSLQALHLPLVSKSEDAKNGLAFQFLADGSEPGAAPVLTGHEDGMITVNIAEADNVQREERRLQMHEPYRTLLGHFRHEIGHYYWDRLIKDGDWLHSFRKVFGDESEDYAQALVRHYQQGAPKDWRECFISAYAASHAWEDWAETWAHYLHMTDTLETAEACGFVLQPTELPEPLADSVTGGADGAPTSFDKMIERWYPLTYVLNSLNRGLGLQDGYPFVLTTPVIDKLRFVHDVVTTTGNQPQDRDLSLKGASHETASVEMEPSPGSSGPGSLGGHRPVAG